LEVRLSGVVKNNSTSAIPASISGLGDSPDCNTGCTQTVTTSNTNLNITNGDVVCVTGNNITVASMVMAELFVSAKLCYSPERIIKW